MNGARELIIIEPHLRGNAGHYGEFVRALAERAGPHLARIHVHGGVGVESTPLLAHPRISAHATFAPNDHFAEWRWLAKAARENADPSARILVLTARAAHAGWLEAVAGGRTSTLERFCLYFHWRERSATQRIIQSLSRRVRRHVLAVAPTAATAAFLRTIGWQRVKEVPYPILPAATATASPSTTPAPTAERPARLLVAGAMRMNKGVHLIAELNERLRANPIGVTLVVQTSGKRDGAHGRKEASALARLERSAWDGLMLDPRAPGSDDYGARFNGALTLTPYDPEAFADNVSGVALDALLRGSPLVATAGTWQARLIERTGAGVVMRGWDADALEEAVRTAVQGWATVSQEATRASASLAVEHDPAHLVRALAED